MFMRKASLAALATLGMAVLGAVGCTPLQLNPAALRVDDVPPGATGDDTEPAAGEPASQTRPPVQATYSVSIRPERGRSKKVDVPLESGDTVQTALEKTKLIRRFRKMQIKVVRVTPQSQGMPVPLNVEYDSAKRQVSVLHDMALWPGDRLIVVQDKSTRLSNFVKQATGVFRGR